MPPQPIDRVKLGAEYRLHFDSLDHRSEVAQAMAECIAKWSGVELNLGFFFTSLLHINEQQGAELYASLESSNAKKQAIRALCVSSLNDRSIDLVVRLQRYITSQQKVRDKLGHWIIGYSDDIPDALILTDPKVIWPVAGGSSQDFREAFRDRNRKPMSRIASRPVPRDGVYVYKRVDIQADTRAFVELAALILKFTSFVKQIPDSPIWRSLYDELDRDARLATNRSP